MLARAGRWARPERVEQRSSPEATFLRSRPLTRAAVAFADELHAGQEREADRAPFILHPLEVAALLSAHRYDDQVTAAAVLHDSIEGSDATGDQIADRFGPRVAELVGTLTEPAEASGPSAKEVLRDQIAQADPEAAAIYAADKVSKLRELRIHLSRAPGFAEEPVAGQKLDHYWKSLAILERRLGDHPLVVQLRFELEALRELPPADARTRGT